MLLAAIAVLLGLAGLLWSADRFVTGASVLARSFGMSPLLIGMIIVGFGTSAPELVVSVSAAWQQNGGIAVGNVLGSNIGNIGLILGITALCLPIAVSSEILRKELPILLGFTLLQGALLWDGNLVQWEGGALLVCFGIYVSWSILESVRHPNDALGSDMVHHLQATARPDSWAWISTILGFLLLIGCSRLLVWGAVTIARALSVPDLIVGLTIVAVGTSLPELASSIMAIRRGENDLALGNVIGSNMFNSTAVLGSAGLVQPLVVLREIFIRDYLVMLSFCCLLFIMGFGFKNKGGRINRLEGSLLLFFYVIYLVWLIGESQRWPSDA